MLTRREVVQCGLKAIVATRVAPVRKRPQAILLLGGTTFVGPALVKVASRRGHTITLFNRGRTHPELFPEIEKLRGDRDLEREDLSQLKGKRRWNAVIDIWPSNPAITEATAKMLADRCDYFYYISSISCYADYSKLSLVETDPIKSGPPIGYGHEKAVSERLVQSMFGTRAGIARPCAIVGPRDPSLSFYYWLSKVQKAKPLVAPGDGHDWVQVVDVRDVAEWIVDCVEQCRPGPYNVLNDAITFKSFLESSRAALGGKGELVWVDGNLLRTKYKIRPFDNMPYWNPDRPGFEHISSAKAQAAGWRSRPFSSAVRDAWKAYQETVGPNIQFPQSQWGYNWGIASALEEQVLNDQDDLAMTSR